MELERRRDKKPLFIGLYMLAVAIYIIIGLQPAEAADYDISTKLSIPSIGLVSDVTELEPENNVLPTPDTIVGSYAETKNKTLLIGHSTTVFKDLNMVRLGDTLRYKDTNYQVVAIDTLQKSDIDMSELLSESAYDTLVVMTCAGELLSGGDATHRLILTAVAIE